MNKNVQRLLIGTSLLSMTALVTGCTLRNRVKTEKPETDILASYNDRYLAPSMVYHSGETWYMMLNTLGGLKFGISVSGDPGEVHQVYDADGSVIDSMSADGDFAAWGEYNSRDGSTAWKLYNADAGQVITAHAISSGYKLQNRKCVMYDGRCYYIVNDPEAGTAELIEYTAESGEERTVLSASSADDPNCLSVNRNGNMITFAAPDADGNPRIQVFDVSSRQIVEIRVPPECTAVCDAAYSSADGLCMIYGDNGGKAPVILLCTPDGTCVRTVWSFAKNCYAFRRQVMYGNGRISWCNRRTTSDAYIAYFAAYCYDVKADVCFRVDRAYQSAVDEQEGLLCLAYTRAFRLGEVELVRARVE